MIHCRFCDTWKPESEYHLDTRSGSRGRQCKACRQVAIEEYARSNPRGRAIRLRASAARRARKAGLPITISIDWVLERLSTNRCAVTGIEFDFSASAGHSRPFAPSLDRINPALGYTEENTQVVCWIYNRAKGEGDPADVIRLARALVP